MNMAPHQKQPKPKQGEPTDSEFFLLQWISRQAEVTEKDIRGRSGAHLGELGLIAVDAAAGLPAGRRRIVVTERGNELLARET